MTDFPKTLTEEANAILTLQSENARLRGALEQIAASRIAEEARRLSLKKTDTLRKVVKKQLKDTPQ